jgi:hypothetical protein
MQELIKEQRYFSKAKLYDKWRSETDCPYVRGIPWPNVNLAQSSKHTASFHVTFRSKSG